MTDKERRVSKYMPFDALKGLKEEVEKKNKKIFKEQFPELSEEQKQEMDEILFECYSRNKIIVFSYYEDGVFNLYSGVIKKIDLINKQLYLIPKKKFLLDRIKEVGIK